MVAKYELFMNCSNDFIAIGKNKYDCQTLNTKGIRDVNGQLWLKNIKYFRLSTEHFMHISILYIYTCMYSFSEKYL